MSEVWDCYFCNVNDKLASIRVDLGIRSTIPDPDRPWLLWVWVYFKQPRPNGLSSEEEFEKLVSLEDSLQIAIEKKSPSVCGSSGAGDERLESPVHFLACRSAGRAIISEDAGSVIGPPKEKRT